MASLLRNSNKILEVSDTDAINNFTELGQILAELSLYFLP